MVEISKGLTFLRHFLRILFVCLINSMCMTDTTSQLESTAPELLPLWVRHGHEVPAELAGDLNLGGVRRLGRDHNYPGASRKMRYIGLKSMLLPPNAVVWCLRHPGIAGGGLFRHGYP